MDVDGDRGPAARDPESAPAVLVAFELDKALYELDYERAHRPTGYHLPLGAIHRLVDGGE